jgi:hypothetical protein
VAPSGFTVEQMTVHRSTERATPEQYSRASLMVDGARLPLDTVARALGLTTARTAHLVAVGRLRAADEIVVLPKGCGPHLAGVVVGDPGAVLHVLGCDACTALEEAMAEGVRIARARWTGQQPTTAGRAVPRARTIPAPPPRRAATAAAVPVPPPGRG